MKVGEDMGWLLNGYKTYIGAGLYAASVFVRAAFPEMVALADFLEELAKIFIVIGVAHKLAKVTK